VSACDRRAFGGGVDQALPEPAVLFDLLAQRIPDMFGYLPGVADHGLGVARDLEDEAQVRLDGCAEALERCARRGQRCERRQRVLPDVLAAVTITASTSASRDG